MARTTNGSSTYLSIADQSTLRIAFPLSISFWWKGTSPGAFTYLISKVVTAGDHPSYGFSCNSSQDIRFIVGWGSNNGEFVASAVVANATFFDNTWHNLVGVYDGAGVYMHFDGATTTSPTAETRAIAYSTPALIVGSFDGTQLYAGGTIAELSMWNAALTLSDANSLFKGFSAKAIRPDKLVAYWPLIGRGTTEPDLRSGLNFTNFSTVQADHPRIIIPSNQAMRKYVSTPAAPQTKGKQFMPFFS